MEGKAIVNALYATEYAHTTAAISLLNQFVRLG